MTPRRARLDVPSETCRPAQRSLLDPTMTFQILPDSESCGSSLFVATASLCLQACMYIYI